MAKANAYYSQIVAALLIAAIAMRAAPAALATAASTRRRSNIKNIMKTETLATYKPTPKAKTGLNP